MAIEYAVYSYLFYKIITPGAIKKGLIYAATFVLAYLVICVFKTPHDGYSSTASAISSLMLLIYCIVYLFQEINNPTTHFVYATPTFWVVVALMIYSSGTFFPFIFSQTHMEEETFRKDYDLIHDSLYIIRTMMFSLAMFMNGKTHKIN